MAISLGTLVVDLIAKTGGFVDGMSKARVEAQHAAKGIQDSFESLGGIAEKAFAPFGAVGGQLAVSLGSIGSTVNAVTNSLSGMVGKLGLVGVGVASVAGAVAGLGLAGAGIAAFAANGASEFHEMSEKTGVSVEALSSLSYAAKQTGVATDVLAGGLEKMSKSAFAAAIAPDGTKTAYSRLGIAIKDTNGQLRPTTELLDEIAAKFEKMPNGPQKTALAMQIFGRAGAEMIPLLNEGSEGIKKMTDEASVFGVTISGQTAAQARQFEQGLDKVEAALQGAANAVMKQLLPSMMAFVNFVTEDLKDPSGIFQTLGRVILDMVVPSFKILTGAIASVVTAGDYFVSFMSNGFDFVTKLVIGLGNALADLKSGGFRAAGNELKASFSEGLKDFEKGIIADTQKADDRLTKFFATTVHGADPFEQQKQQKHSFAPDQSQQIKSNVVQDAIAKLKAQVDAEDKLANAISGTTAQTIIATAAADALKTIEELQAEAIKRNIPFTMAQKSAIEQLTLSLAAYKKEADVNKQLEDFIQKTDVATQSVLAEANAFTKTAAVIEAAQEQAKIAPFQKQVDDITELISAQKALGASESQLKDQMSSLASAQQKLNAAKNSVHSQAQAEETRSLNETSNSLTIQIEKLGQYTSAILNGAEAVRQFNIAQQVQAFAQKNPLLSADEIEQYRQKLQQVSDLEQVQAAAEKVAGELNYTQIEKQITILEKMRQQVKEGSDEQKSIDAVLHKDRQQELQDYDNLLAQSGKLSDGFKLFFTEYANNAKTAAQQVNDVMTSSMNSIEGSLTKFITGQKNAFKGLGTAIEQSLAKTAVQDVMKKAVGGIGSLFGIKTPGAKRDGNSKSSALYVTNVADGAVSAAAKAAGGLLGPGGGTPDGGKAWDQFMQSADLFGGDKQGSGNLLGKMTGGFGSMFKGIGSIFSSLGG
ncbi:MAG TPA: phage tail tape measure C-terminal domain-containing protein, partial [Candidatus Angelobacter sp.]|nr:phage tail tape measure C-terminal domain-containing protein [Candidatus Angelobacter sp.]